jgi:hypothetical protein
VNTEELIAKAKEFCEREYVETKTFYNGEWSSACYHDESIVRLALQRCLGVVQFIQTCGVKFEDVSWYEDYREKFFEILEKNI